MHESTTTTTTAYLIQKNGQRLENIYVDDDNNGPTIYLAIESEHRVKKWVQGTSQGAQGVQVGGECFYCTGVWVDKEKNVYLSSAGKHCVFKWSPQTNITTVVAGREYYSGSTSDNLNSPEGIYVDSTNGAVYVADYVNNRIQKWLVNASNGTTEAGLSNGNEGSDAESLSRPTAVWVDEETHVVYVADSSNERIQRWLYNASMGDTIAGGSGLGDKPNRFDQPVDLAFDNNGNLYVELSRIQIDLNTQHFIDEYGRIFHDDDSNNLHQWGFYTSWMGVNYHSEDEINQEYLSQLSIAIQMKENKGIYALLDCHQDIFSRYFCGEGVSD
ncbi:unnamed protein product [Rotaria sordida]|uniref:NHL repeat containing protein n=1 Tax=Rotaria sordida TaxID=392033 RepID=A0A819K213_9BILA|nr:unnamed protein product [Rotaria sordida]